MIIIPFPISIAGLKETEICRWVTMMDGVQLSECCFYIEFEDEELVSYFKLRFGL